ncbi:MAG: methyltransferase [Balneolaceae bacterium]
MNIDLLDKNLTISRYPKTSNKSLQAWNASDELMLEYVEKLDVKSKSIAIYNDRFGFLGCFLSEFKPFVIIDYKSQQKACRLNLEANNLSIPEDQFLSPLAPLPQKIDIAFIKIPKSLDLFRLYLYQVSQNLSDEAVVVCGFMTKYFSPQMLSIAEEFFEDVEQSLAKKKSRILILKKKKSAKEISIINTISLGDAETGQKSIQQYFGVFSANNIDFATQYLMDQLQVKENEHRVLDLACGNGVLAYAVQANYPNREVHVQDDSILAIESAKLNLDGRLTHFHYDDTLDEFEDEYFDLVVSNPPFHFEYETNIEISLGLFHQVKRCLKPDGRFLCVANQHLNYKTHLEKIFPAVKTVAENNKFVIYEAS